MSGVFYDGDDTYIKGDDGSEDGAKITSVLEGTKKRLDVSATDIIAILRLVVR